MTNEGQFSGGRDVRSQTVKGGEQDCEPDNIHPRDLHNKPHAVQQPAGSDQYRTTTFFTMGIAFAPPGQVNKGLARAVRLFNRLGPTKLGATDVNIVLVLHSGAT